MRHSLALAVAWSGAFLSAVLLLSFFGSLFWILDLAANYRPQLSVVLVTWGGLVLVCKVSRLGWSTMAIGAAGLLTLVPHALNTPRRIADESPTIRIMSFNAEISNPNRAAVAAYIADEDPDIVFIFESSFEWEDTIRAADLPLQIVSMVPRGRLAGVTVLARPELRPGLVVVDLPGEVAAVSLDLGSDRIEVLGIHPLSPTSARRSHARDRLIAQAAEWVVARDGEVIVVGDLNATPWSHAYATLRLRGGLVDTLRGRGIQPTWPEGWGPLMIPIDHILHTTGLGSRNRHTGPAFGSSHRPVIVEIGWAD